MFEEIINAVYEEYGIKIDSCVRNRGALLARSGLDSYAIKEIECQIDRVRLEYDIKEYIEEHTEIKCDQYIMQKEGELTFQFEEKTYAIKRSYNASELEIKNEAHLIGAVRNLAFCHEALREMNSNNNISCEEIETRFRKKIVEMKKVRGYIRDKGSWSDFDLQYLKNFKDFYEQALGAEKQLASISNQLHAGLIDTYYIHGEYNRHNILVNRNEWYIVNFDRCGIGIQIMDLYVFLRKAMEKNDWNITLGRRIIEEYNRCLKLSDIEHMLLKAFLVFPEKYWKVANHYHNANKTWISKRSQEKLYVILNQMEARNKFLNSIYD